MIDHIGPAVVVCAVRQDQEQIDLVVYKGNLEAGCHTASFNCEREGLDTLMDEELTDHIIQIVKDAGFDINNLVIDWDR